MTSQYFFAVIMLQMLSTVLVLYWTSNIPYKYLIHKLIKKMSVVSWGKYWEMFSFVVLQYKWVSEMYCPNI